ncbi:ArsR/SmtB family transcription factor [Maritalea sp.]|uniref:ArsR/SmtB family transcription factor n=1 Tax=Maritalea sp. TaxID=2003361 RepID=UPI003EF287A4
MDSQQLDHIFFALSDPVRRGILSRLSTGEQNVGDLTKTFAISQPAISRHLKVLDRADLVRRKKRGREQFISVNARAADEAAKWIHYYSNLWHHQFDLVEQKLKQLENSDERTD